MFESASEGINGYCSWLPLMADHPLIREVGLQAQTGLACGQNLMEVNYYGRIPKSVSSVNWPLVCFHCSSDHGVQVDEELSTQHTTVRPQCHSCREKKIAVIHAGRTKQCKAAPDARRKAAKKQQRIEQVWKENKQPVPKPTAVYDVHQIVDKAKQGKLKKVAWKHRMTGELCGARCGALCIGCCVLVLANYSSGKSRQ